MWRLDDLKDGTRLGDVHHAAAGIATAARALLEEGAEAGREAAAFFVPGRIEVLGKHTDYAGGRSLVAATRQGFTLVAVPRADRRLRLADANLGHRLELEIRGDLEPEAGHWSCYPATVARRLARNFPPAAGRAALRGADVAFASSLPPAAGLSSSSALIVAVYLALAKVNGLASRPEHRAEISRPEDLAGYLGSVENGRSFGALAGDRGVGTFGGSEDHTAILCSRAGELRQYRYCPVRRERAIAMPRDYVFAVAASGVAAEKTGAARDAYNRASRLAAEAAAQWRRATGRGDPHLGAILGGARRRARMGHLREILGTDALVDRARHFLAESEEIVPAAGDALARGDLAAFGRLVDRSQSLGAELLGNQVPETVFLAASARQCGATAASAFGAGFGGSVWAMVARDDAGDFLDAWSRRYRKRFPARRTSASFLVTDAGPGAVEITRPIS